MELVELPIVLALSFLAVYVLAILLRVSCHFCGVEVPGLGRAMLAAALVNGVSLILALVLQAMLVGPRRGDLGPQFVSLAMGLATHLMLSLGAYSLLLRVRVGQAFSIWLVQALVAVAFAVLLGCCFGGLSMLG